MSDIPFDLLDLSREPMARQPARVLRHGIVTMRPGEMLSEQAPLSCSPAREAPIELGKGRLTRAPPQHGTLVVPISRTIAEDARLTREAAEAAQKARPAAIDGLSGRPEQQRRAQHSGACEAASRSVRDGTATPAGRAPRMNPSPFKQGNRTRA